MDELTEDFLAETYDNLLVLDNDLIELENNPENPEPLDSVFRIMHTIKGTCGFLGLDKLGAVAHAGENIMVQIRDKRIQADKNNVSIIFEAVDTIKLIMNHISKHGQEPEDDYSKIIKRINDSASSTKKNISKKAPSKKKRNKIEDEELEKITSKKIEDVDPSVTKKSNDNSQRNTELKTVRVNVSVLENLMQIVGELVLTRNQLLQLNRNINDNQFNHPLQRLNTITSLLQESIMETRMQPINNAWIQIPRIVRDLSAELKKNIRLEMIGKDTELDRQLIESIKDPLLHMIRNSADHGLESADERIAIGKPEEGVITLEAYHQSGHIIIKVSDDGRGIDVNKIKEKIIQKSLATENDLELLTDQQIIQYIFRGGFSTAEVVTSLSGRGVGMDVVQNNIGHIRGTVEIQSVFGEGSTFVIKIPLTLAIISIVVVEVNQQKFGIPQLNVIEMVRSDTNSESSIDEINGYKILKLRDKILPLITLSDILYPLEVNEDKSADIINYVVVCEVNGSQFGLIVDRIHDTEEIVLKPVSKIFQSIEIYSGNTLLGNGEIIMIFDISGLFKYLSPAYNNNINHSLIKHKVEELKDTLSSFLVIKDQGNYKAIPLELVTRLEEIDATKIENSGDKKVIQYNNSLMYLATIESQQQILNIGKQQVVVLEDDEHIIGLVVEEIIDIVEQDIENDTVLEDSDLKSLVLSGKTMDIVDINGVFSKVFHIKEPTIRSSELKNNILLIDDSVYFRKLLSGIIEDEGFKISCCKTAAKAMEVLEDGENNFDLIITDINMPDIDGLQFSQLCYKNTNLKNIPIIALVSNTELSDDIIESNSSNIKVMVSKTNHDELIEIIHSFLD